MNAQELMTRDPAWVTPQDPARRAAELMIQHDCGAIPVVDNERSRHICGMITDRDIALRGVARGGGADTRVQELMTSTVESCSPEAEIEEVERVMSERQVRRVPVIDADGQLVGIIAQADLALEERAISDQDVGEVVERISDPDRKIRGASAD